MHIGKRMRKARNFNRYWYANNNPYRFTDPDGRYSCDSPSTCAAISKMVSVLKTSQHAKNLDAGERARIRQAVKYIGSENDGQGPLYRSGSLGDDGGANTDMQGNTTVDLDNLSDPVTGAAAIAHEADHDVLASIIGIPTIEPIVVQFEDSGYKTTNAVLKANKKSVSPQEHQENVNSSVLKWRKKNPRERLPPPPPPPRLPPPKLTK